VLEAVPNVSEGRDEAAIAAIGEAFATSALLLDVHAAVDHPRSVFTLAGPDAELVDSLLAGIAGAVAVVDLDAHEGVHPRVGAADVVPLVPVTRDDMPRAISAALVVARRVGEELGLPVFRYGEIGSGRRPAFFRRGGLDELCRRVETGELVPDDGPSRIERRSGAVLVGARAPLVAYNVELTSGDVRVARDIAAAVRESSGGMPGVQAVGLLLPRTGRVQVSMNVIDLVRAPLHEVVERVRCEAEARGVGVAGGELVGLVPQGAVRAAVEAGVEIPGVDESRVLEDVLASRLAEWPSGPS
jgi:glutamate formiminotransferase